MRLKLQYAGFLFDHLHQKQQTLQELFKLEDLNPSFEESFLIYSLMLRLSKKKFNTFLRKHIEKEIIESNRKTNKSGSSFDVLDEFAFQTLEKKFKSNIEKSATLHIEFWSLLSEENPELSRLCEVGMRINNLDAVIENDWAKIAKLNINSLYRLMAKYLLFITHDSNEANRLMERLIIVIFSKKSVLKDENEHDSGN